jgi:hypothetical protein
MVKKVDYYIGSFFNRYRDFGSFISVVSMLLSAISGGTILLLSFLFIKYNPDRFLDSLMVFIKLWPLHLALVIFPISLYLIDRGSGGYIE